jgi:hypothetical protein
MLYYRLYFFHPTKGQIVRFAEYEAADDGAAIALAHREQDDMPQELWCRHRMVARRAAVGALEARSMNSAK